MRVKIFNQKYKLFALSLIILSGILVYSNTFYSPFHLDDNASIVANPSIKNISNLKAIWTFYPPRFITHLSIALNYHLSQLKVVSYHLFNLTIHLSSAVLVWWLMLLTLWTPRMKDQLIAKDAKVIAFFAGLIFVTHPVQTQGVTYIIQRAASLATFFYLLSISLYVQSRRLEDQKQGSVISRLFYSGSLIAAVLAMFTKEMAITLPLTVLLYETCFLKIDKKLKKKFFIIFFMTIWIIPLTVIMTKSIYVRGLQIVSATVPTDISPWEYLFTQFRVIVTYLRLLFIPINQNVDYDYPIAKSLLELPVLSSFILLILIFIIAIRIYSKYRLMSFGILWFFLTLLVESSIIPIKDVIFEHRLYLPMVGFSFFLVSFIYYLFQKRTMKSTVIVLLIITICYAFLSYRRNLIWQNEFALWDDAVHKSPKKARPYNNRGVAYGKLGRSSQAIADYNRAIAINPNYVEAYYNRGNEYDEQGNFTQAIADYTKAIEINPNYLEAYLNRGMVYGKLGSFSQSIAEYNKAIDINPNFAEAYYNRGIIYDKQRNLTKAIGEYTKAIAINPDYLEPHINRGIAYSREGNFTQALANFTQAIIINPNFAEAYYNRGLAYDKQGNFTQAMTDYMKAIAINSNYAKAYNNLGVIYSKEGNLSEALANFSKAIATNPNFAEAYNNRGTTYYHRKEYDKAWLDVYKAEKLGAKLNFQFLEDLEKASGKEK